MAHARIATFLLLAAVGNAYACSAPPGESVEKESQKVDGRIKVTIDFPDIEDVTVKLTYDEVVKLTGEKHAYKVKFWILGAFAKGKLTYSIEKIGGKEVVTTICGVANDEARHWVYFVNGFRSPYHINTQSAEDVRTIRFEREPINREAKTE